ncbi:hypothetical protein [Natronohydrobacter thiooxidans]|uniref:hypothetical protein n=1 Tax=Natronohydrobacter thiooxidans TaxID=87172 RepID=UPI0008FF72C9|nr:hypothetical protein [Natronohydrobacter thiooxidans]
MFDPVTLWMQSSLVWIRLLKQQQDFYLQFLGNMAETIPHEDSAALGREAEAMKQVLKPVEKRSARKPVARPVARVSELASA